MVVKKTLGICQSGTSHLLRSQAIAHTRKRNQRSKCIFLLIKSLFITRFLCQFGKTTKLNSYLFFSLCIPPGTVNILHINYELKIHLIKFQAEKRSCTNTDVSLQGRKAQAISLNRNYSFIMHFYCPSKCITLGYLPVIKPSQRKAALHKNKDETFYLKFQKFIPLVCTFFSNLWSQPTPHFLGNKASLLKQLKYIPSFLLGTF